MRTTVIKIDPDGFDPDELERPARILKDGGLVAFPTETVYGIGANAHNPEAVHRLRQCKDRPPGKKFSLHIADIEVVASLVDLMNKGGFRERAAAGAAPRSVPPGVAMGLELEHDASVRTVE